MASPQRLTGWGDALSYEVHVSFFGQFSFWLSVMSDYLLKIPFKCKPFFRCVATMFPDLYLLFGALYHDYGESSSWGLIRYSLDVAY